MTIRRFVYIFIIGAMLMGAVVIAQNDSVAFFGTQFSPVEEGEKFRAILDNFEGSVSYFSQLQEDEVLALLQAEASADEGSVDLIGILHGGFPALRDAKLLMDLSAWLDTLSADRSFAFVEEGKLGTEDYQYYIPWMQATYIMAAHVDALDYLPPSADIMTLSWDELRQWAKNIFDETGEARLGFPVGSGGLWHRFMQGYIYPSYTGGMVTAFKGDAAVEMFRFLKDLWPYVNLQSRTYSNMFEPMLAGEVWIAFDHTARLIPAFAEMPDDFIAFPAPAGPAGRGFMPVIVGLGVPETTSNLEEAKALIDFLTLPETQARVLSDLGFFPVVSGVDTAGFPPEVALAAEAVTAQAAASDALPALLPVGLGGRSGEFNDIYRTVFERIVLDAEAINTVLEEEAVKLQTLLDEIGATCWPPDPPSDGACQIN